jgi:predicted nucleic acid-binding protein
VLIGVEEAIFSLYGGIVIPAAVYAELTDAGAPAGLRRWLQQSLDRIEIRHVILPDDPRLQTLDAGEAEAIFLAEQTRDALLLIDEKDGRTEARRRGIKITGLLGVIRDAALSGYVDFEEALSRFKDTDFRVSSEVETLIRAQYQLSR